MSSARSSEPLWLPDISAMTNGGCAVPTAVPSMTTSRTGDLPVIVLNSPLAGRSAPPAVLGPQLDLDDLVLGAVDVAPVGARLGETVPAVQLADRRVGPQHLPAQHREVQYVERIADHIALDLEPGGQQLAALVEAGNVEVEAPDGL